MAPEPFLKVIIETALLTDDEKVIACLLAKEAGADFVKTSTGFSGGGATVEDITLMRRVVGPEWVLKPPVAFVQQKMLRRWSKPVPPASAPVPV